MKQILLFLFLCLLSILSRPSWGQSVGSASSTGLIARYPLDEVPGATTAKDITRQLADGTLVDTGGSWQPNGGHDGGGALALTGTAHLDIPLNWQPTDFSCSFWLKPTTLFDYGQLTGAKARWGAFLFHSANNGQLYVGTDINHRIVTPSGKVQLGVWQHFVFTFANGVGTIYKNGKVLSSQSGMVASLPWQGLSLGYLGGETFYDEVRVYNRAISAQEVGGLYGHYEAEEIPTAQLVRANIGSSNGVTYAENLTQAGTAGQTRSTVPFTISVPEAGIYTITARYATASDYLQTLSVYVNGRDVTQAQFPTTRSWGTWNTQNVQVALQAGSNTIAYTYDTDDNGWVNLDYIEVDADPLSAGFRTGGISTTDWFPKEVSVDKFTGTAQLYLPLHTVQVNGLAVPIGLSYAATGVQVDNEGGEVGANWSLTGQVSISREVRGLPDDRRIIEINPNRSRYGWLVYPTGSADAATRIAAVPDASPSLAASTCISTEQTALQQLNQLGNIGQVLSGTANLSLYDSEPDVFFYSLPGHSGKFVFDAQGRARTMPYDAITITHPPIDPEQGIQSFTIRTADGTTYTFDGLETIEKKITDITKSPAYFLREYSLYKLLNNYNVFQYVHQWRASKVATAAGDQITFSYQSTVTSSTTPIRTSRQISRGNASDTGVKDYETETIIHKLWLSSITSPSSTLTCHLLPVDDSEYFLESLDITTNLSATPTLVKKYLFDYLHPKAIDGDWYDKDGAPITTGIGNTRRFLQAIRLTNGCTTQPLYEFAYNRTTAETVALPPIGANDRDYWGFYNANGSQTLIPKVYVYPQLLSQASVVAGAPYRLFPASTYPNNGFVLPGADRRPAANFQQALAGTLTTVSLPGGGKVRLEYEGHHFYDGVAQQSYPAGGMRIRAIRVQDPITGIETRREYSYQLDDGRASGVLLRIPHFALALPALGSTVQERWTNATARCGDDLSSDPFESRSIGYQQVSERVLGKGQVVTTYHTPGNADETTAADGTIAGVTWSRPIMGVARPTACPSVAPIQATTEIYPFAPATNYDFRRGLPQVNYYQAEPIGNAAPVTVRQENFTYQYRNLAPSLPTVTGLAYDQLLTGTDNTYAYAKYPILTDFLYATRLQLTFNNQSIATVIATQYNYNSQGWLAAQATRNSNGTSYRTRYKYLSDYALIGTSNEPKFQAMQQRATLADKQISSDVVETISETIDATGVVRVAGATLNTFALALVNPSTSPTRPYQVFRWQPAVPQARANYDSVQVITSAANGRALYVPTTFHLASTLAETTSNLVPLSTRTETGRQIAAVQLGYANTLPVLRITNALASETVFSDFESSKAMSFQAQTSAYQAIAPSTQAARTGLQGTELSGGSFLSSPLPTADAPMYRLSFWARATSGATCTVSITGGPGGTPPAAQTVSVASTWQLYELLFNLAAIPRAIRNSYVLKLQATSTLQVDDVMFLPAAASAASTTYDPTKGKTSETNERGRTLSYEYTPLGDLARVRDHNGAIIKQFEKVIAGQLTAAPSPSFGISGVPYEGQTLTFTGTATCGSNLEYNWDFGDNTTTAFNTFSSTNTVATHSFSAVGHEVGYFIKLRVRIKGQSKFYETIKYINISPQPLAISTCVNGVVAIDNCGDVADRLVNSCDGGNPPNTSTTFTVSVAGNVRYRWETLPPGLNNWQTVSGATTPSLTVAPRTLNLYRCTILDMAGNVLGASANFSVERYSSRGTQQQPCPTQP